MTSVCANGHSAGHYRDGTCKQCRKNNNRRGYELHPLRWRLYDARRRARRCGVPFTITLQDIKDVWPADDRCPVFGTRFKTGKRGPLLQSATLDRVIPEKGYVVGNIAIISKRANTIKSGESDPANIHRVAEWLAKVLAPAVLKPRA